MRVNDKQILYGINALTVLLILTIILFPNNVLRIALGVPLVLLFPGYALISALFPRNKSLSGVERLALSFGLSVAIVPLIGLALNFTPWGIRLYPIVISLFIFIVLMSFIAWYRGRRFSPEERVSLQISFKFPRITGLWANQTRGSRILTIALGVMILGAVGILGYVASLPRSLDKYTEFYLLDSRGKAEEYPTAINLGQSGTVILGIINHEYALTDYHVETIIDGVDSGEAASISLDAEGKWEKAVTFTPSHTGKDQKVEFLLYKNTAVEVYERVHLWVEVK